MLLIVKNGISRGIFHEIYQYAAANNKYTKEYNKNNESLYIMYSAANSLYGCACLKKLSVDNFEWKKKISKFKENFIRNYDEDSGEEYILEVEVDSKYIKMTGP